MRFEGAGICKFWNSLLMLSVACTSAFPRPEGKNSGGEWGQI